MTMSIEEENKAMIRRYFELLSGTDKPSAVVEEYVLDEELKEFIAWSETAFPGFELTIEDIIAEGDKVAVRALTKGIHKGDFFGLPVDGNKEVIQPFLVIYRIADGKIVEHWLTINRLEVMQQLGVIPEDLGVLVKG